MNFALIFAGGVGSRMGANIPKQFLEIDNKPILIHTLARFNDNPNIDQIILVIVKDYFALANELIDKYQLRKVARIIEGGSTAFESQYLGINVVKSLSQNDEDIILIHDGVRPLIHEELINRCIEAVKDKGSAITVSSASETIAVLNPNNTINYTVPREKCLIARAPQCFYLKDIYAAHMRAKKEGKEYIDSASMLLDQGFSLNPIMGPVENIKITTQYDYLLAKLLLGKRPHEED